MLFRAEPASSRLTHDLGVMTLVYHRRSGITHMLSEPAPQILAALDALGPADAAAVAMHLANRFDMETENGDIEAVIAARLDELAALGLVARDPA